MLKMIFANKVATQCGTCRFWQADEDVDDVVLGECRIHAPEFNALPLYRSGDERAGLAGRALPLTESRDWCAEWRK